MGSAKQGTGSGLGSHGTQPAAAPMGGAKQPSMGIPKPGPGVAQPKKPLHGGY